MTYYQPAGGVVDQNSIQELNINPLDVNHQIAASGAIDPHTPGRYVITKGGVAALTLGAPVAGAEDGLQITIYSDTAYAHTITTAGLLVTGTADTNVITFPAYAGGSVSLVAFQGKWIVDSIVAASATS